MVKNSEIKLSGALFLTLNLLLVVVVALKSKALQFQVKRKKTFESDHSHYLKT